jgi:mono/diheme cytochrome c family protein
MKISKAIGLFIAIVSLSGIISGCFRGEPSDKPPIDIVRDMDDQPKYQPQGESKFFADGASMRPAVPGTVAHGKLIDDPLFFQGLDSSGNFVAVSPVPVTPELLSRGRERFDIYCSPCHSRLGDGRGVVVERGYNPPPSFHTDRIREFRDGEFFNVITHGVRTMPAYGPQIKPADRWAIVSYIRALQRSQNATINDIPEELRGRVR